MPGKRIIDQEITRVIDQDDMIIVDSRKDGTRQLSFFDLLTAISDFFNFKADVMKKSEYDNNGNGYVDNAEKINGHTVESDVPPNAAFTDTVYDDSNLVERTSGKAPVNDTDLANKKYVDDIVGDINGILATIVDGGESYADNG